MSKVRFSIVAYQNGSPVGYVKSISYKNSTFQLTKNKSQAKGYLSNDRVQAEIDTLSRIGYSQGFMFGYEE
jgi:hypothetical protein